MQFGCIAYIECNIIPFSQRITDIKQTRFCFINKPQSAGKKIIIYIHFPVLVFHQPAVRKKEQVRIE